MPSFAELSHNFICAWPIGGLCEAIQTLQEAVSQSNTSPTRKSLAKSLACAIDGMPTESFHAVSDYRRMTYVRLEQHACTWR